jgi:hypothetical protein
MESIQLTLADGFRGRNVLLLSMNGDGIAAVRLALEKCKRGEHSEVNAGPETIAFKVEPNEARIEMHDSPIVWMLALNKIDEILAKLDAMEKSPIACHHYVDISSPTDTLVLSKDEYPIAGVSGK